MKDLRNFLWVGILLGGIILLISVFTPMSYYIQPGVQSYSWLWGFGYYNIEGISSEFYFWLIFEPFQINLANGIVGILLSSATLIGSIKLITMGNNIRMNRIGLKEQEVKLSKIGGLMVIVPIIYVITRYLIVNLYYLFLGIEISFVLWGGVSNPGFAFIGPFIGGALVIISVVVSKKITPGEEPIKIGEFKKAITNTPVEAKIGRRNFCPECGKKLADKESKFCIHCGFEIPI